MVGKIVVILHTYCYLCNASIKPSISPICESCLNEPMEVIMPYNDCSQCAQKAPTLKPCAQSVLIGSVSIPVVLCTIMRTTRSQRLLPKCHRFMLSPIMSHPLDYISLCLIQYDKNRKLHSRTEEGRSGCAHFHHKPLLPLLFYHLVPSPISPRFPAVK